MDQMRCAHRARTRQVHDTSPFKARSFSHMRGREPQRRLGRLLGSGIGSNISIRRMLTHVRDEGEDCSAPQARQLTGKQQKNQAFESCRRYFNISGWQFQYKSWKSLLLSAMHDDRGKTSEEHTHSTHSSSSSAHSLSQSVLLTPLSLTRLSLACV